MSDQRGVSPTMAKLLELRNSLARERARLEGARTEAHGNEADARLRYEEAKARAYLDAQGSTVKEKEARATLATLDEFGALQGAVAVRRANEGAGRMLEKEYDALAAAFHAYNREIKMELDLAKTMHGDSA